MAIETGGAESATVAESPRAELGAPVEPRSEHPAIKPLRIILHDDSTGVGGGQRWSRDLARWLSSRGHVVGATADWRILPNIPAPVDYWLDMRPTGDPTLAPKGTRHVVWAHIPTSIKHVELVAKGSLVIASSQWTANRLRETWGVQAKVVPLFTEAMSLPIKTPRKRGILFLGRLNRPKGAIQALELYKAGGFRCGLTLAGATWATPPELLEALRTLADAAGVPVVENPTDGEVEDLYQHHRIFWNPAGLPGTQPEAFGFAAADAWVKRLIVIAAKEGGVREWLSERCLACSAEEFISLTRQALQGRLAPASDAEVETVRPPRFIAGLAAAGLPW